MPVARVCAVGILQWTNGCRCAARLHLPLLLLLQQNN
jgi:hypothetical protein